ncbi:MAG: hypothetical protein EXR77_12815 [Myxococcales bacterium]|nr:hypothetical protein [Myxococcales bacterium]
MIGPNGRWQAIGLGGVAVAILGSRLPWLPGQVWDHDSANFARSLSNFDLHAHSPHAPGYPLYVALARLAQAVGVETAAALAWPAVLMAVVAALAVAATVGVLAGVVAVDRGSEHDWRPIAAGLAYGLLPSAWLGDLAPRPDGLAAHGVVVAACALLTGRAGWRPGLPLAALALGLSLGIRLSNWPLVALLSLWLPRRWWPLLALAVAGWLVPLVLLSGGLRPFWQLTTTFGHGHFADWGNTAFAVHAQANWPLATRLGQWAAHVWVQGGLAFAVALVWAAWAGWHQRRVLTGPTPVHPALVATTAALLGYALWLVVAQNPDHPRHVWPLLALAAAAAVVAIGVWLSPRVATLGLSVVAVVSLVHGAVAVPWTRQPSPDAALAALVAAQPPEQFAVAGGSEIGLIRALAPRIRSVKIAALSQANAALAPQGNWPRRAWLSVRGPWTARPAGLGPHWQPIAHFGARPHLDSPAMALTVYQGLTPASLADQQRPGARP